MQSEIQPNTIVKDWFGVDFTRGGEVINKQVLWGIVVIDHKGRRPSTNSGQYIPRATGNRSRSDQTVS